VDSLLLIVTVICGLCSTFLFLLALFHSQLMMEKSSWNSI